MNWRHYTPPFLWGLGQKASSVSGLIVRYMGLGQPAWTGQDFAALAKEGYTQNTTVYACVNQIARAMAGIPWILYEERRGTGTRSKMYVPSIMSKALHRHSLKRLVEMDIGHPMLKLLGRPNPKQGGAEFIEAVAGFLLLSGNTYQEELSPDTRDAPPLELWALRPDRMRAVPMGEELVGKWEYRLGSKKDLDPRHVLHMRLFHPLDDIYGLSPISVAARSVDMDNAADAWNTALLQNGGRPPGILAVQATPDNPYAMMQPDVADRVEDKLKDKYRQAAKGGEPMLIEGGLKWQEMGLSPQDAAWLQTKNVAGIQICRAYNMPPELVGFTEQKTYSNVREARRALYTEIALPLMDRLRDAYNGWLTPRFGDRLRLDYDIDAIEALQEDRRALWTSVTQAVGGPWLSPNEGRATAGYDEKPGADDIRPRAAGNQQTAAAQPAAAASPNPPKSGRSRSIKALNLQTDEQKATYWKAFDNQRAPWYPKIAKLIAQRFTDEGQALVTAITAAADVDGAWAAVEAIIGAQEAEWQKLFTATYLGVVGDFGQQTLDGFRQSAAALQVGPTTTPPVIPEVFDVWETTVQHWIATEAGTKITEIAGTTLNNLTGEILQGARDALAAGADQGETILEMAARLNQVYEGWTMERAAVIARTEVIAASNLGSQMAAMQSGLNLVKFWIATKDTRTRGNKPKDKFNHVKADGQRRPLMEPYEVSGEKLMFPGDSSLGASGGNVISCRCTQGYEVVEAQAAA